MAYQTAVKTALNESALTANATSSVYETDSTYGVSVHTIWTSTTASATVKLQVSNDNVNWVDHGTISSTINNNSGNEITEAVIYSKYMRVHCAYSSGTITTLKVYVNTKGM